VACVAVAAEHRRRSRERVGRPAWLRLGACSGAACAVVVRRLASLAVRLRRWVPGRGVSDRDRRSAHPAASRRVSGCCVERGAGGSRRGVPSAGRGRGRALRVCFARCVRRCRLDRAGPSARCGGRRGAEGRAGRGDAPFVRRRRGLVRRGAAVRRRAGPDSRRGGAAGRGRAHGRRAAGRRRGGAAGEHNHNAEAVVLDVGPDAAGLELPGFGVVLRDIAQDSPQHSPLDSPQ